MADQGEQNEFERWLAALQEAIREREQAMFSATVLAEARQPQNMGFLEDADGYAIEFGSCGDVMEFSVRLNGERIEQVAFMTNGCGPTVACGSMLTRMAEGKSLEEASTIEAAEVIIALDGLPAEHVHCATLAVSALHQAIADCSPREKSG